MRLMHRLAATAIGFTLGLGALAYSQVQEDPPEDPPNRGATAAISWLAAGEPDVTPQVLGAPSSRPVRRRLGRHLATELVRPSDLAYRGAFRLPDRIEGSPEQATFEYGGTALAFRAAGDPSGANDGFPGSLYLNGLDVEAWIAEVSIPTPVVSPSKNLDELQVARIIQPFSDLRGNLFNTLTEIPRLGLCVLTTPQTGEKIHLAWGQHFQEDQAFRLPSHAWCNPNLASPQLAGAWWIGEQSPYSVNGFMFEIPEAWAVAHTAGRRLATGRFRDGGWSGRGPSLFAYAPWHSGNPPAPGTRLQDTTLLLYSHTRWDPGDPTDTMLAGYQHPDEWEGGAFLTTTDGRSAVIFVGAKAVGQYYWYGWINPAGPEIPCVELHAVGDTACFTADGSPCPDSLNRECEGHTSERGWWSSRWAAEIIFYDPADLAAVAAGAIPSGAPQPYAVLAIDERLFLPNPPVEPDSIGVGQQRRYRIGDVAYDRNQGNLYISERFADGAKPLIHVFALR